MNAVVALLVGLLAFPPIPGGPPRAPAADPGARLVVAVDRSAGLGLDGDTVRRAISEQLHVSVVAPSDAAAAGAARILVVSADKGTIRVVLRADDRVVMTGTIAAAADRALRLRDIAWLAGSLVRDQAADASPPPAPNPKQAAASEMPGPISVGARNDAASAPVDTITARAAPPARSGRPEWMVAVVGGPTFASGGAPILYAAMYRLDVQRRSAPGAPAIGVMVQFGTGTTGGHVSGTGADQYGKHLGGIGVLVSKEWRGPRGYADVAAAGGVETAYTTSPGTLSWIVPFSSGLGNTTPVPSTMPFFQLSASAGVALGSRLDLFVRPLAHLSPHGLETSYAAGVAGVRLRIP